MVGHWQSNPTLLWNKSVLIITYCFSKRFQSTLEMWIVHLDVQSNKTVENLLITKGMVHSCWNTRVSIIHPCILQFHTRIQFFTAISSFPPPSTPSNYRIQEPILQAEVCRISSVTAFSAASHVVWDLRWTFQGDIEGHRSRRQKSLVQLFDSNPT